MADSKSFKALLEENKNKAAHKKVHGKGDEYERKNALLSSFGNFMDKKNDIRITASTHAKSQAKDRRPEYTKVDWEQLHKKVAQKIDDNGLYDDAWILFYSKSMKQGYICVLKYIDRRGLLDVRVITVLPKGKNNPQGGNSGGTTVLELMESANNNIVELSESTVLLENIEDVKVFEID